MDKEQLLLAITRLEVTNKLNFEIIKGYQEVIQNNMQTLETLKIQLSNLS